MIKVITFSEMQFKVVADGGVCVYNSREHKSQVLDFLQIEDGTTGSPLYEGRDLSKAVDAAEKYLDGADPWMCEDGRTGAYKLFYRCVAIYAGDSKSDEWYELVSARNIDMADILN